MCTTRLTSAFFSFPRFFPYLESKAQPYHHIIMHWLFNSFAYKVQLKLILVYCTCFIKTVLVFTVSAERVPSKVLSHTQTHPHRHPHHDHAPTPVRCEGQTPEIRQLLGIRVVDFFFFLKREKHGGMHLAMTLLIKSVYINIYGS